MNWPPLYTGTRACSGPVRIGTDGIRVFPGLGKPPEPGTPGTQVDIFYRVGVGRCQDDGRTYSLVQAASRTEGPPLAQGSIHGVEQCIRLIILGPIDAQHIGPEALIARPISPSYGLLLHLVATHEGEGGEAMPCVR
jgi:hypothetical protein